MVLGSGVYPVMMAKAKKAERSIVESTSIETI